MVDNTPLDWRKVLKIYLSHVEELAGTSFLNHIGPIDDLDDAEIEALKMMLEKRDG